MNEAYLHPGAALRRLKTDVFGCVDLCNTGTAGDAPAVRRDTTAARWWARWLAVWLASREARALRALEGVAGVPRLLAWRDGVLLRTWIEGRPMQEARPADARYFRAARRLLRTLHRRGVAHNDLAKEPNWLVTAQGLPALVDYQLATVRRRPGRLFRSLAREDLRHLLKHKRTYCPDRLTPTDRQLLARRSWFSRVWIRAGKPVYLWVTRRWLGWADREGAGDRQL
ncbi:MAG: serine/threonine protein kinase [Planctomycetes bacterium]|nr:serine/threonine protein kinase [Planctomycetota bacterium]